MTKHSAGTIAVIFVAQRSSLDDAGYTIAAEDMANLAALQPGYLGIDSVRDQSGLGITISYWRNDAYAIAWRDNAEHTIIRDAGRDRWYTHYDLHVSALTRSYDWEKTV